MSVVSMQVGGQSIQIDSNQGLDLSIAYRFQGDRLNAFGVNPSSWQTVENNDFRGGRQGKTGCKVNQYTLIPHCHGTHTECIGHIIDNGLSIHEILKDVWIPCLILTLKPEKANTNHDRYASNVAEHDVVITKDQLCQGFKKFPDENFQQALIIRTLPNDVSKKVRHYSTAAYFSNDAMQVIAHHPVKHLLVDLPSVDRMEDQGKLSNHRIFWQLFAENQQRGQQAVSAKTITELIFVANEIKDGYYLLNLQISPFIADAAPSRPLVFPALKL